MTQETDRDGVGTGSALDRLYDAALGGPWELNDETLWCPNCGDIISPSWFFDNEDYEPPEHCRQCGYPDFGQ